MAGGPIQPELREWVEIVVEDNVDDLLSYLRRRVAQPEDAADLLGRVLLALWEGAARVPTIDQDARMWCFGIARNILRENHRRSAKQLAWADGMRDSLRSAAVADAADTVAEVRMRADEVRGALATLDERSRELVMLIHWDGFSIAEAARILGINVSTGRTRYGRALRRLEKQLAAPPPVPSRPRVPHPDLINGAG
jgi:RNA polymerase sigma-70 factor, ECF subfamily